MGLNAFMDVEIFNQENTSESKKGKIFVNYLSKDNLFTSPKEYKISSGMFPGIEQLQFWYDPKKDDYEILKDGESFGRVNKNGHVLVTME